MKVLRVGTWLALGLALLILGLDTPPAGAESASLRITGAAFRPRSSSVTFGTGRGGSVYALSDPTIVWDAPVYLPQGAVVTKVRMFYKDNVTANCDGYFTANDFAIMDYFAQWYVASSGSSSSVAYADVPFIEHTIDYSKYAYSLSWRPNVTGSDMLLVGFQIFYTPPPRGAVVIPLY